MGGIPPASRGIVGENRSTRIVYGVDSPSVFDEGGYALKTVTLFDKKVHF